MTTLPQTTPLRLPRPSGSTQLAIPNAMLPATIGPVNVSQPMTGGDVWRVLRANLWLIILLVILGAGAGYGINVWLERNDSSWTAASLLRVEAPMHYDMATLNNPAPLDPAATKLRQQSQANLLLDPALFTDVLSVQNTDLHDSKWFKSFVNPQEIKKSMRDNLKVAPLPETELLQVSYTAADPESAKIVLKAIVDDHIRLEKIANSHTINDRLVTLKGTQATYDMRRGTLGSDISDLQDQLQKLGYYSNGKVSIKELQLQQLSDQLTRVNIEKDRSEQEYKTVQGQIDNDQDPPKVAEMVALDSQVQQARSAVQEMQSRVEELEGRYDANSQVVQDAKNRLLIEQKRLADATGEARVRFRASAISEAKEQADAMARLATTTTDQIQKLQAEMANIADLAARLSLKQNELQSNETKAREIQDELDQIEQFGQKQQFSGVDWAAGPPETPEARSFPKLSVVMSLSIGVGLLLALGVAFLREVMDTTIRSPRDISRVGNLNLLGMVPHEDDDPQSAGARLPVVIFEAPHSMMAEQLRQVRTRLQHSSSLDNNRSILITSPGPGDGKSTIACNLASGLALNGRRILLVDANFRRPELHRVFNLGNEQGFSDVLNSIELFEHAVQETQVPNLYILPSGPKPTNATELLESQLLLDFIERALEEFDHVIFDSGPLLFVSETVALAPRVDGVITVVRARSNTRGVLSRTRDTLRQVKAENLGVVLNAVRAQGGGYYGRNIRTYYEYQNGHDSAVS